MRAVMIAALLLCLPCVAGADPVFRLVDDPKYKEEIDRFLAEQVQPHLKNGDKQMNRIKNDLYGKPEAIALAHYVRALVEIEAEKLRRGK